MNPIAEFIEANGISAIAKRHRHGNAFHDATLESFFAGLKLERARRRVDEKFAEAGANVFGHVEVLYNRKSRHKYPGEISETEFERRKLVAPECSRNTEIRPR